MKGHRCERDKCKVQTCPNNPIYRSSKAQELQDRVRAMRLRFCPPEPIQTTTESGSYDEQN